MELFIFEHPDLLCQGLERLGLLLFIYFNLIAATE